MSKVEFHTTLFFATQTGNHDKGGNLKDVIANFRVDGDSPRLVDLESTNISSVTAKIWQSKRHRNIEFYLVDNDPKDTRALGLVRQNIHAIADAKSTVRFQFGVTARHGGSEIFSIILFDPKGTISRAPGLTPGNTLAVSFSLPDAYVSFGDSQEPME